METQKNEAHFKTYWLDSILIFTQLVNYKCESFVESVPTCSSLRKCIPLNLNHESTSDNYESQ